MRELPLLAPQWLLSDPRGRGSNFPFPDYNHGSPHSQTTGGVRNPQTWGMHMASRFVYDRGCGYTYRSKLCRARKLVPNSGWSPIGSNSTELTIPSCIRPSKRLPPARGVASELWNAHVWPHERRTERRWSDSHLSPTDTLYLASKYGFALVELNSALNPLDKLIHSISDRGKLMFSIRK
jgi:hypothetical protein